MTDLVDNSVGRDLPARLQQFHNLLAEQWEYEMRESPEFATTIGDYRYNDRWSEYSLGHVEENKRDLETWRRRFEDIDTTGFPEQEKLNQALMVRNLRERIENINLKNYEMPVDQFSGLHLQLAQFVHFIPFESTTHYGDYVSRLRQIPALTDALIETLQQGVRDRLMPPRFLLEKTARQCELIADPPGAENLFGQPVAHFPESVPAADRKSLLETVLSSVDNDVRPSYKKLASFIEKDYAPEGRPEPGMWFLPDGDIRYRFAIRRMTTTDMEPEAIHQLGLDEITRIESEQLKVAKTFGFSDLKSLRASLKTNPELIPASGEQILERYRHYIAQMEGQLTKVFERLPNTKLEVRPLEKYREKEAAAAQYYPPTPDGSRPGAILVNTGSYQERSLLTVESTTYHEGIPGHHMQFSIAQTLPGLPPFRQHAHYPAYIEGWALYAESLAKELGFYQDAYSDLGRLSDELLRAVRLVLDTGVHFKRWTRQQMVDFFHEHTSLDELDIQVETDRYIALPAQALAYKIGQLQILKLREYALSKLASNYDLRTFHGQILDSGPLPLDMLETHVRSWISARSLASSGEAG